MEKRIILTSLFVALIFSSFIIYSSFAQTLPICVAPQQYLYWQPGQHAAGYVPFASTSINFLMRSPIYVSSTNVGIGTNNPQARLHVVGGILSTGNYAFQTGSDIWRGALYGYGTSSATIFALTQQGVRVDLYSISPWQHLGRGDIYVRNVNASNDVIANRFCIGTNCINQWPSQVAQYWTLSGNNLYTSSTNWNVGIGTNNPLGYRLRVEGGNVLIGNGNTDPSIVFKGRSGDNHAAIRWVTNDLSTQKVALGVYGDNAWFYPVGNVGIGTTNPQAKLHVVGDILSSNKAAIGLNYTGRAMLTIRSTTGTVPGIEVIAGSNLPSADYIRLMNGEGNVVYSVSGIAGRVSQGATIIEPKVGDLIDNILGVRDGKGNPLLYVKNTGNVGIGTAYPQANLHVVSRGEGRIISQGTWPGVWMWSTQTTNRAFVGSASANNDIGFWTSRAGWGLVMLQNGNVGIGTTSPQARLHVMGDILSSNKITANQFCIGNNCINQLPSQVAQYWTLSGNNLYTSSTNWNVGIGTNNPQYKLQVVSGPGRWTAINADGSIVVNRNGAPPYILFQGSGGGISLIYNPSEGTGGRAMAFYTQADGQNYSEKVRITGAGNVGIGTNNPQQKLDVAGNIKAQNIYANNAQFTGYVNANGLNITGSGYIQDNLGIGTNRPQARLEVAGAIRLTPQTATPTPIAGTMYFDQNSGVFKCFQKTGVDRNNNPTYGWVDCVGQGPQPPSGVATLTVPVRIYDSSGQRIVLEINEEF